MKSGWGPLTPSEARGTSRWLHIYLWILHRESCWGPPNLHNWNVTSGKPPASKGLQVPLKPGPSRWLPWMAAHECTRQPFMGVTLRAPASKGLPWLAVMDIPGSHAFMGVTLRARLQRDSREWLPMDIPGSHSWESPWGPRLQRDFHEWLSTISKYKLYPSCSR